VKGPGLRDVIALTLAIILWAFVRLTRSGPSSESLAQIQMNLPIQVKGLKGQLVAYEMSSDQVRITVQGQSAAITSLREQQLNAYVDVGNEDAPSMYLKVTAIAPGGMRVISVEPENINLKQAQLTSKQVPIRISLKGNAAEGRHPGKPAFEPRTARVSGPEPLVAEVREVQTSIFLNGESETTTVELRDLAPVNGSGQRVEGRRVPLKIIPSSLSVTLPIEAQDRSVAVAVSLDNVRVGKLPGWRMAFEVEPEFITLRVGKDQDAPHFVLTRPEVFVASSKVDSHEVPLLIPDGFEVIGARSVKVRLVPTRQATPPPAPTPLPGSSK
jgi:YbbR domain-containing protein